MENSYSNLEQHAHIWLGLKAYGFHRILVNGNIDLFGEVLWLNHLKKPNNVLYYRVGQLVVVMSTTTTELVMVVYRIRKEEHKDTALLSVKTFIVLISPFSLSSHGSRKTWIANTMCGLISSFFYEQDTFLILDLFFVHSLRKCLCPRNQTNKRKSESKNPSSYVEVHRTPDPHSHFWWGTSSNQHPSPIASDLHKTRQIKHILLHRAHWKRWWTLPTRLSSGR